MVTRVREMRENMGITQDQLGKRSGLNGNTVNAIECGRRKNIYLATLRKLANALGVQVGNLIVHY